MLPLIKTELVFKGTICKKSKIILICHRDSGIMCNITYRTHQQQQYSQNICIKKNLLQTANHVDVLKSCFGATHRRLQIIAVYRVSAAEQPQAARNDWATMAEATKCPAAVARLPAAAGQYKILHLILSQIRVLFRSLHLYRHQLYNVIKGEAKMKDSSVKYHA